MATAIGLVEITPRLMAEAFWAMNSVEQAQFFEQLNYVIGDTAYGHGEMQWCYLSGALDKNKAAKEQACSMLAWVFNRATNYLQRSL